jgi:hypothetical protein
MEQETPLPEATGLGTSETMDEADDFVEAGGGRTVIKFEFRPAFVFAAAPRP